jgi:GH15 family glucan-1,4-alpha-glucosidase
MVRAAGDHALLADGRTAALLAEDGEVSWLCWPRVDSDPILLSLLDDQRGGTFSLRPRSPEAAVERREAVDDGLVTRTAWRDGDGRLLVYDALAWDGRPGLIRVLRAERRPVLVEVRFRPAFAWAGVEPQLTESGRRVTATGDGLQVAVDGPAPWRIEAGVAVSVFRVVPGYPAAVALGDAAGTPGLGDVPDRLTATLRWWRATLSACDLDLHEDDLAVRGCGLEAALRRLRRAAAVLVGLHQRGGGIVAAPTSSLPQYPGSSRTWDYRFSWPRDTSLAALALLRLGLVDDAHSLGAFVGDLCVDGLPPTLVRVDETAAPPEREVAHLSGHGGATPVRCGNAAAGQGQLDVAGECLELAWELARARALPESLRRAVPRLADGVVGAAWLPDHGIWEIRGDPQLYTHSRVLAWSGLRQAAALAAAGVVDGDSAGWAEAAAGIRLRVLRECVDATGALTLRADAGGGPDSSLMQAVTTGFLSPQDPRAAATLVAVESRLERSGLVDRYEGQPDGLEAPSLPFVFPTFWVARARELLGLDGRLRFAAAAACAGALDLMGEVADPATSTPHGNLPQVQSHAALVLAARSRLTGSR